MAEQIRHYRVAQSALLLPGRTVPQGEIVTSAELAETCGQDAEARLTRGENPALVEATPSEARAYEVAHLPHTEPGTPDDQAFIETLAERAAAEGGGAIDPAAGTGPFTHPSPRQDATEVQPERQRRGGR